MALLYDAAIDNLNVLQSITISNSKKDRSPVEHIKSIKRHHMTFMALVRVDIIDPASSTLGEGFVAKRSNRILRTLNFALSVIFKRSTAPFFKEKLSSDCANIVKYAQKGADRVEKSMEPDFVYAQTAMSGI
jgi:hypothetical protein